MTNELPMPDLVKTSKKAMELARIWIVDGDQHVVLSSHLWDDPSAWGLMLVDLARHVSRAYAKQGISEEVALSKIRKSFDVEWKNPTI